MHHPSGTVAPVDPQNLIAQPDYAKQLRPLLPDEAFTPDRATPIILGLNGAILLLGWAMARQLDASHWQGLLIFLPFALVMGNAVVVLLFATHDLMHSKAIRQPQLRQAVQVLGLALLWMPPPCGRPFTTESITARPIPNRIRIATTPFSNRTAGVSGSRTSSFPRWKFIPSGCGWG